MERLFVDTSAWYAFINRRDPAHKAVAKVLQQYTGRLVTSNFVLDETLSLCLYRMGHDVATAAGNVLMDPQAVDLVRITSKDEQLAWQLFCARSDQRFSFTDCTSFVLMRRLRIDTALALDGDFRSEGFTVIP